MIFELIQSNFIAVVITLFLILFVMTNNNFEKNTNRCFLAAAFCILILIVEEAWEARLALDSFYTPMRALLSAVGYSLRPMIPFLLLLSSHVYKKSRLLLLSVPVIFNILISFSALFCKLSFWYTPENEFMRGPLGFTPFIVAGFYVVVILYQTIRNCRKGGFTEAMIVSAIVLLAFLSTIMESMFGFRFIQNPCMATSITFYYLFLHSNQSNRDLLTDSLSRRKFYLDSSKFAAALSAVISLDLNDLKVLNDRYGHIEGDKALVCVAEVVKKYMGAKAGLYRTGGDEFMILCFKLSEENVCKIIEKIRSDLDKTPYRCALGYAMHTNRDDFEHTCQLADINMYENKRQMKSAMKKPVKDEFTSD